MNIGIIGDGQLGRMLALSGYPLGFNFAFLGRKNSPSGTLGVVFDSIQALDNFADVITFESENTDVNLINNLKTPVFPPIEALAKSQNRSLEKSLFKDLNIPHTPYIVINSLTQLQTAIKQIGTPSILKTTTNGYDGKGQFIIKNSNECEKAWQHLQGVEAILEAFVEFEFETSIIAVTNQTQTQYYPMTVNTHHNGILRFSTINDVSENLQQQAKYYTDKIIKKLNYIGVLTIEFFVTKNGLVANEIAPRVHNSGHWSINGAQTSQFENHLRAISNYSLGTTKKTHQQSAMLNLIGDIGNYHEILKIDDVYLHLYCKPPKPNRKVGHINIATNSQIQPIIDLVLKHI